MNKEQTERIAHEITDLNKQLEDLNKKIFDFKCHQKYLEKKKKIAEEELKRLNA